MTNRCFIQTCFASLAIAATPIASAIDYDGQGHIACDINMTTTIKTVSETHEMKMHGLMDFDISKDNNEYLMDGTDHITVTDEDGEEVKDVTLPTVPVDVTVKGNRVELIFIDGFPDDDDNNADDDDTYFVKHNLAMSSSHLTAEEIENDDIQSISKELFLEDDFDEDDLVKFVYPKRGGRAKMFAFDPESNRWIDPFKTLNGQSMTITDPNGDPVVVTFSAKGECQFTPAN